MIKSKFVSYRKKENLMSKTTAYKLYMYSVYLRMLIVLEIIISQ